MKNVQKSFDTKGTLPSKIIGEGDNYSKMIMSFSRAKDNIILLLRTRHFSNFLWMLTSQAGRLGIQVLYFIFLARSLSTVGYGQFVLASSYVALFTPLLSLGLGNIFSMHAASNRSLLPFAVGNSLLASSIVGTLYAAIVYFIILYFYHDRNYSVIVLLVSISDALFMRVIENASWLFMATENLKYSALVQMYLYAARLVGLFILIYLGAVNVFNWSIVYLLVTVLVSLIAAFYVSKEISSVRFDFPLLKLDLKRGIKFSLAGLAQGQYGTIDKIIVERLLGFSGVGIYAAAQRVIFIGYMPVNALFASSYASFFRHGQYGLKSALDYARKILPLSVSLGFLSSLFLFLTASAIPSLLGSGYKEAVPIVQILSVIPLLQSVYYLFADSLIGSGFVSLRTIVYIIGIISIWFLNAWLTKLYSVPGAAISLLSSEIVLLVCFCIGSLYASKKASVSS